jgi:hypothetical protein
MEKALSPGPFPLLVQSVAKKIMPALGTLAAVLANFAFVLCRAMFCAVRLQDKPFAAYGVKSAGLISGLYISTRHPKNEWKKAGKARSTMLCVMSRHHAPLGLKAMG